MLQSGCMTKKLALLLPMISTTSVLCSLCSCSCLCIAGRLNSTRLNLTDHPISTQHTTASQLKLRNSRSMPPQPTITALSQQNSTTQPRYSSYISLLNTSPPYSSTLHTHPPPPTPPPPITTLTNTPTKSLPTTPLPTLPPLPFPPLNPSIPSHRITP